MEDYADDVPGEYNLARDIVRTLPSDYGTDIDRTIRKSGGIG